MKPERLQEIKVVYTLPYGEEYPTEAAHDLGMDIAELIAAYENQGELLQLSLANVDRLNEELAEWKMHSDKVGETWQLKWTEDIADLRKQLAEASDIARFFRENAEKRAKSQEAKLAEAQAEVERLRASHEELTPEEIKNKYFPNQTWEELGRKRAKSIFDKEI